MLDVYRAVEAGNTFLHVDLDTNTNCVVGGNIQALLEKNYQLVQSAAEIQMQKITLDVITNDILRLTSGNE